MSRVCAIVVTHERVALLRECLDAVLGQTRPPDHVLVVDNASGDATPDVLAEEYTGRVEVLRLPTNEGSAGGFHAGMRAGVAGGWDWLWVMDDDTVPDPTALALLLAAPARLQGLPDPVLLASRVVWTDGRIHPMNPPGPKLLPIDHMVDAVQRGLLPLRGNTFPSLLVRRDAVERHGPPRKGYFIWSDDIDFTQRILRDEAGYLVPESIAVHRTRTPHRPSEGGERFYFAMRNGIWILRGDTLIWKEKIGWSFVIAEQVRLFVLRERFRPWALRVLLRGVRDGLLRPVPGL